MKKSYTGTSGYSYDHWAGVFYPEDLARGDWFAYYCRYFKSVELNVTFYRLVSEKIFQSWYEKSSPDFKFAIKGSRYITQFKRLDNIENSVKIFFERANLLNEKLSVVLWQLPPNFESDPQKLENFCEIISKRSQVRQCFEFRHKSWFTEKNYKILSYYNMPVVLADYPFDLRIGGMNWKKEDEREVVEIPKIGDFIYFRRHGAIALYSSKYPKQLLGEYSRVINDWLKQADVYVYFNNDAHGNAVLNAEFLSQELVNK